MNIAHATVIPMLFLGPGGYEPRALVEVTLRPLRQTDPPLKQKIELKYDRSKGNFEAPGNSAMFQILHTCRAKDKPVAVLNLKTIVTDFSSDSGKTAVEPQDRIPEREGKRLQEALIRVVSGPAR